MIKAFKGYVLVERKKAPENKHGIILTENTANTLSVKGRLIDKMSDQLNTIQIGDIVYVDKRKSLDIEGHDELFFVPEEAVVGRG